MNEQRRLAYVALTGTSDQLTFSTSVAVGLASARGMGIKVDKVVRPGGKLMAKTIASTYLAELGPNSPAPVLAASTGSPPTEPTTNPAGRRKHRDSRS